MSRFCLGQSKTPYLLCSSLIDKGALCKGSLVLVKSPFDELVSS